MSTESCKSRKQGILRVEVGKSKLSSAVSVEFKEVEPTSPQPSVDRLSVSFATDEKKLDPGLITTSSITEKEEENEDEEEEYSASANVILERNRDSWKRRNSKRRASSPFLPSSDFVRRRSSIFTVSSGDTGTSGDEVANQNMRIHKEVVSQIKYQPWPMRRKLRMVQQAKTYIKLHEGQIQERLAQNKSTRDILAHAKILFRNYWSYFKRELSNLINNMIPWEYRIKEIESHFGSAVASYFTFHRWLFSVNLKISLALLILVMLPEIFWANRDPSFAGERKRMLPDEKENSKKFLTLWNFEGILKHSAIFYGYYNSRNSPKDSSLENKLPLIYFATGLGVYVYSFVAILRKMAENSRQSKLTEKDEDCIFTWKLFTSWDFMIGNTETANNRISSIILGFKEALLEEAEKTREEKRNWKLFSIRIFTHVNVLWLLGSSMYAVIFVVGRSLEKRTGWWNQNEVTIVITLIGMIYPQIFDLIGYLEKYHPRKALRLQLARIMVLNLLNLYSFIFATFSNIGKISALSNCTKPNATMIALYRNCGRSMKPATLALIGASIISSRSPDFSKNDISALMHDPSEMVLSDFNINSHNKSILMINHYDKTEFENSPHNIVFKGQYTRPMGEPMIPTNVNEFKSTADYSMLYSSIEDLKHTSYDSTPTSASEITPVVNTDETSTFSSNTTVSMGYNDEKNTVSAEEVEEDWTTDNNSYFYTRFSSQETTTDTYSTKDEYLTHPPSTSLYQINDDESIGEKINTHSPYGETTTLHEPNTEQAHKIPNINIVGKVNKILNSTTSNTTKKSTESNYSSCYENPEKYKDISPYARFLDNTTRKRIHELCWETMFGQELVKLTVMDLWMTSLSIIMVDFFRALFVRYMNSCWCWDLEKTFPQYGDFKIAENILHLVNNQGMVWMGMFFSPGLPLINVLKLVLLMYLRSWAVLTCNVPHEVVFRASRSNNFYFGLLLTMLFLCVLPVGFALVRIDASWHCGPFSFHKKIYYIFTTFLKNILPESIRTVLDYVASPGIIIPLLVLLILIIYYLISLTNALREANDDLKIQLRRERTEERRKVFQMANKRKKGFNASESPFNKWCRALNTNISAKTSIDNSAIIMFGEKIHSKTLKNPTFKESKVLGHFENTSEKRDNVSNSSERNAASISENERERYGKNSVTSDVFRDREDSVISGWSVDKIPEIKISESNSLDNISRKSPDTFSQSKSSSKETIINLDNGKEKEDEMQDDVFGTDTNLHYKENSEGSHMSVKEEMGNNITIGQEDIENKKSIVHRDSCESIPEVIKETDDIGKMPPQELKDQSDESRKNFAKIFVESLKK